MMWAWRSQHHPAETFAPFAVDLRASSVGPEDKPGYARARPVHTRDGEDPVKRLNGRIEISGERGRN
ncbi:MAG TPA: hypothetical protein VHC72_11770, partial [Bryobacteraceae bacterium]|nr:hypothetical protein [Bryobacteraceae bacterium]